MITKVKKFTGRVVTNDISWNDNKLTPPKVTTGDLKQWWDNVDTKRLERISDIKANN